MRRQFKITRPATPANESEDCRGKDGVQPDGTQATEDLAPGHSAPAKSGDHHEHDNYGHDRASMDGAEAHEVEVEHVTLEEIAALEQQCDAVDEAFEVSVALEELAELTKSGPLSASAAKAISIATEHMLGRIGIAESVVALEDFDKSDAVDVEAKEVQDSAAATSKTGSAIMSKVKQIWQAIIQALIKAKRWIKDFLRRLFDDSSSLLKRAEALAAKADTRVPLAQEFWRAANPLLLQGLVRNLSQHGHWPQNIAKAAHDTAGILTMQFNRLHSPSLVDGSFLEKIADPAYVNNIKYNPHDQIEQSHLTEKGADIDKEAGLSSTGDFTVHATPGMLGGYRIVQAILDRSATGEDALRAMVHTPELKLTNPGNSQQVNGADIESAKVIAGAAKVMAQCVVNVRDLQSRLDKLADEMIAACKRLENDAEHRSTWQRYYLSKAPRMFVSEPAKLVSYALRTARAMLQYGELVLQVSTASKIEVGPEEFHRTQAHADQQQREHEERINASRAQADEIRRQHEQHMRETEEHLRKARESMNKMHGGRKAA